MLTKLIVKGYGILLRVLINQLATNDVLRPRVCMNGTEAASVDDECYRSASVIYNEFI
jgi:hypothetical protein